MKRVLSACFTIADREVTTLRESDEHANVIRYFCTEEDPEFRYIALEFCVGSLQDYVEARKDLPKLDPLKLLFQATSGLVHLHQLKVVHRDVKPQNVLLSTPNSKGDTRAMISDFGLCKKLNPGKKSFSKISGIAGTEGWIAPEMMMPEEQTVSYAVDVFSLGCVYYYVLSKGFHPFGVSFRRQANILSRDYKLDKLTNSTAKNVIEKMIAHEAKDRPNANSLIRHPVFWSKERILTFLMVRSIY